MDLKTTQSREFLAGRGIHEQWESDYLNPDLERFYEEAFSRVVELLGARAGDTVLDAGCGYCFHASRFARRGLRVVGVDFSAAALTKARRYLDEQGLSGAVELREGDLLQLPFPDDSFSFVNCWGVLMHIPEVERALGELVRVLKPGGRIALTENNAGSLHVRLWEPSLRLVKRVIGRRGPALSHGPRGQEEWHGGGDRGGLLVRKTNMGWLRATMSRLGAPLKHRQAAQFTELYTSLPWRPARKAVVAFNALWFRRVRQAGLAMGNILVFEKPPR